MPTNVNEIRKITKHFIINPEFLREKHANEDFINTELIVFGGQKQRQNWQISIKNILNV